MLADAVATCGKDGRAGSGHAVGVHEFVVAAGLDFGHVDWAYTSVLLFRVCLVSSALKGVIVTDLSMLSASPIKAVASATP